MYKVKILSTAQVGSFESSLDLQPGNEVLIDFENIVEVGIVLCQDCKKNDQEELPEINFLRILTSEDKEIKKKLKEKAKGFLDEARLKVFRHGLNMKILDSDLSFDEKKLTFYFSAEGRIDFRSLVSDMVGSFRKIIRLQQIGPRDEAKMYGGFGKCGRPLCCATFLNNLEAVTLEMAEVQEINGGKTSKITGCCGKLMCCMSYEADLYKEIKAKMPKIGMMLKTKDAEGKVVGHNLIEKKVIIEAGDGKKLEISI